MVCELWHTNEMQITYNYIKNGKRVHTIDIRLTYKQYCLIISGQQSLEKSTLNKEIIMIIIVAIINIITETIYIHKK